MAGDGNYYNVSLLLHGNGANNSTTITDNSLNAVALTAYGNAKISTTQSKFSGSSLAFDGTGDYFKISNTINAGFQFSTGDFSIEMWIYPVSLSSEMGLIDVVLATDIGNRANSLILVLQPTGKLNFFSAGAYRLASTQTIAINTWTKIEFIRVVGVFKYFINGVLDASTLSYSVNITSGGCFIGGYGALYEQVGNYNGYIDELRITKGIARHTSSYTPEAVAFDDFVNSTGNNITKTYLHRAWSPENSAFVFWTDTAINLSPAATIPTSVVANLVNKCVVM